MIQEPNPDLESLRRGPRLRHNRLPPSPSMAVKAGRGIPESTKQLWTGVGRSRKMMIASAVLLELSVLGFVSSVTAVIVSQAERGHPGTGLVAWAAVSSVLVVASGGMLVMAFLQHRNTNKELVSGENWIEMHLRSRPLPPRPRGDQRQHDNGATEAWQKFAVDHEQLRHYVEFLEGRIGVLEEGRSNANQDQQDDGPNAGVLRIDRNNNTAASTENNSIGQPSGSNSARKQMDDTTPKAKKQNVGGSLSRRQLLEPDESAAEPDSWQESERDGTLPKSDTKASILTELCEAVTEGYSPLAEQMPRASLHIPQTPENTTPPASHRGNALRPLVLPGKVAARQNAARSSTFEVEH